MILAVQSPVRPIWPQPDPGGGHHGIYSGAIQPSSLRYRYSAPLGLQMSMSFSLPAGPNHSALPPSEICPRLVLETMQSFLWCPTVRISLLLPISRHPFASRKNDSAQL